MKKNHLTNWKAIQKEIAFPENAELPKISIILPTYNCAQSITLTLESLLEQNYPNYEILIIDGGSRDRTLELVKTFPQEKIQIYSTPIVQRYEMLNKGISHAKGKYINCLFPGDYYISPFTLSLMVRLGLEKDFPHLMYCGTLLRDGKTQVKTLYRLLSRELLENGQQPTSLQSCWFRTDIVRELGKFNTKYFQRGGYDFLCRYMMNSQYRTTSIKRILTDYDLRSVSRSMILRHFWETLRIVFAYYGPVAAWKWLIKQKDISRCFKLWWRNIRVAFFREKKRD